MDGDQLQYVNTQTPRTNSNDILHTLTYVLVREPLSGNIGQEKPKRIGSYPRTNHNENLVNLKRL